MHNHYYIMIGTILGVVVAGFVAYLFGLITSLQKRVKRLEDGTFGMFTPSKEQSSNQISFSTMSPPDMFMRGFGVPPEPPAETRASARINEIENEMDDINNRLSGISDIIPRGDERVRLEERYKFLVHEIVNELTKSVSA